MDQDQPAGYVGDSGVTSVQFVLAAGLALVLFLVFANLVVVQYGRGAVRSALEQGARAGTVQGVRGCEAVASEVVNGLLGGRMSDGVSIQCRLAPGEVVATSSVAFESWTPLTPDFAMTLEARATVEP